MRSFVVSVPAHEVDIVSDRLWQLGVRGIEERTGAMGDVELWTAVGDEREAVDRAAAAVAPWPWRVEVADTAVSDTWREFARPMWVDDRLVIVPAWIETPESDLGVIAVRIEPGGAFGLGDHPTTALSLTSLVKAFDDRELSSNRPAVLDVGCGTGVIAVTAVALGAEHVRAIDISDAAIEATIDNARRNDVLDAVQADTAPLGTIGDTYDIVVANILAPVLVSMAADLARATARGGRLVISGVLADRHEHVLEALTPMVPVSTLERDGWVAVTLRHPDESASGRVDERDDVGRMGE